MNQSIDNIRDTISDYPKLWEWEATFDVLPADVKTILQADSLTLLTDNFVLPGLSVGDMELKYKGASTHYGTRMKLAGTLENITFKEIKGATPEQSWLVRKAFVKWLELVDNFFGSAKSTIQGYKTSLKLNMQDETGASFYKVRYFGIRPTKINDQPMNYTAPPETGGKADVMAHCVVSFQYDYWVDQYSPLFGAE